MVKSSIANVLVKPDDPVLKRVSTNVPVPLNDEAKETVVDMIDILTNKDSPVVLDSLSAPMIGKSLNIIMLSMKLRNSHMRNLPESSNYSYGNRVIVMVNPTIQPEDYSTQSWQYEVNYLEAGKCKGFHLVNRDNFVNVNFTSMNGKKHHLILPFRESRIVQYHMMILKGKDPMNKASKEEQLRIQAQLGLPIFI